MTGNQYAFTAVTEQHAEVAIDLLLAAIDWMNANGGSLWDRDEIANMQINGPNQAGIFYLLSLSSDPAAVFNLSTEDELYWPNEPCKSAVYLHRIAIGMDYRGKDLLRRIVQFAERYAASLGIDRLRLDCDANRPKLRARYEYLGFKLHSFISLDGYYGARYERAIAAPPANEKGKQK